MTKTEYTKFLNSIDRNYEYSDSFSVYKRGERAFKVAQDIARSDDELLTIYNQWIIAENKKCDA